MYFQLPLLCTWASIIWQPTESLVGPYMMLVQLPITLWTLLVWVLSSPMKSLTSRWKGHTSSRCSLNTGGERALGGNTSNIEEYAKSGPALSMRKLGLQELPQWRRWRIELTMPVGECPGGLGWIFSVICVIVYFINNFFYHIHFV